MFDPTVTLRGTAIFAANGERLGEDPDFFAFLPAGFGLRWTGGDLETVSFLTDEERAAFRDYFLPRMRVAEAAATSPAALRAVKKVCPEALSGRERRQLAAAIS